MTEVISPVRREKLSDPGTGMAWVGRISRALMMVVMLSSSSAGGGEAIVFLLGLLAEVRVDVPENSKLTHES